MVHPYMSGMKRRSIFSCVELAISGVNEHDMPHFSSKECYGRIMIPSIFILPLYVILGLRYLYHQFVKNLFFDCQERFLDRALKMSAYSKRLDRTLLKDDDTLRHRERPD